MYTTNLRVSDYNERNYKVEINASWITITDLNTNEVVYRRTPQENTWYDVTHTAIVNALRDLEMAVFHAVSREKEASDAVGKDATPRR